MLALGFRVFRGQGKRTIGQHEAALGLLRSRALGRNAETDSAHGVLDAFGRGLTLVQCQPQPFGHQRDIDIRHSWQAFDRAAHLGGAGPAIHARHAPFALSCAPVGHRGSP